MRAKNCPEKAWKKGFCKEHFYEYERIMDRRRAREDWRQVASGWDEFRRNYLSTINPRCACPDHVKLPYWQRPIATDLDHINGHHRGCAHAMMAEHIRPMAHACHSKRTNATQTTGWARNESKEPRCSVTM